LLHATTWKQFHSILVQQLQPTNWEDTWAFVRTNKVFHLAVDHWLEFGSRAQSKVPHQL
jgi:hypothetical protein